MKSILFLFAALAVTLSTPSISHAQAPNLGIAASYVLFTSDGAVGNSGISQITGNVGTNNGSSTAFGNVNGVMHDGDASSAQCATDLLSAYNQLDALVPTFFPAPLLGNGQTLNAGVYSISGNTTLNLELILDAQGNSAAVFVIQVEGALSANASSKVKLINGALACNVFWKVEGLVSLASGVTMRGTIIANNAAVNMNTGDTLEGRAFSTTGAIAVDGVFAYVPAGCGSPVLTGPTPPIMGSTVCYALFSSNGPVSNTGVSKIIGDVGTNTGLTTGYTVADVTGTIHPSPDVSTGACATDLLVMYNYLNSLSSDIELLYPAQFGKGLVLTPHTYVMNGATTFIDTLFLNAQGNTNAVFVIQANGAFSTGTYANVILMNGAQAKNVFWKIEGSVLINDYSNFKGTIVCNNGSVSITSMANLQGRALSTDGAITTAEITASIPSGCAAIPVGISKINSGTTAETVSIYPNPFSANFSVKWLSKTPTAGTVLKVYNQLGSLLIEQKIENTVSEINTQLPAGVYYYTINDSTGEKQRGKLVSQN